MTEICVIFSFDYLILRGNDSLMMNRGDSLDSSSPDSTPRSIEDYDDPPSPLSAPKLKVTAYF